MHSVLSTNDRNAHFEHTCTQNTTVILVACSFLCSPKGEAYSGRFVRPSVPVRPVPCLANYFKTTVGI